MPKRNPARLAFVLTSSALLAVTLGCGSKERETVKVTGTVTLDGQPLADAAVMFSGDDGASPVTATTDASGQFTVQAVPGPNLVAVSKVETSGTIPLPEDGTMPANGAPVTVKMLVPAKYADFRSSGLTADVAEGMDAVRLELASN